MKSTGGGIDPKVAALIAAAPQEQLTVGGVATQILALAADRDTRGQAIAWFGNLKRRQQAMLVASLANQPNRAREFLYLVPDAATLLPFVDISLVRRLVADNDILVSAIAPERLPQVVRATPTAEARTEWLEMIERAFEEDDDRFGRFIDGISAEELAACLSRQFGTRSIRLLEVSIRDIEELESIFDDTFPFVRRLWTIRHERFVEMVDAIVARIWERYERLATRHPELSGMIWEGPGLPYDYDDDRDE